MIQISEESFAPVGGRQKAFAWLLLALLLMLFAWGGFLFWQTWSDNSNALDDLGTRLSSLRAREVDPSPYVNTLAQSAKISTTVLGYASGATLAEGRTNVERAISAILSANQSQVRSFVRLPELQSGPITRLPLEIMLTAPSSRVVPMLAAFEAANPTIVMRKISIDKRQDGFVNATLRCEAFWTKP